MSADARTLIRSYVERIERLEEEGKTINLDKRDVYAESKSHGLDVKALKTVIQRRRQDASAREEQDALVETYEEALRSAGTASATRAGASGERASAAQ